MITPRIPVPSYNSAMAAAKKVRASSSEDFKHRETLSWKGHTFRYDKAYGQWFLLDRKNAHPNMPRTVSARGDGWDAGQWKPLPTPLAALEASAKALVELRTREAREAEQKAKDLRAEVRRLKRPTW